MAAKGYCTRGLVGDALGVVLTAVQELQVDGLIEEAEALIDRETGRAWLVVSPVTDELRSLTSPLVYLVNTPVTAVTAVSIRSSAIGATWTVLTSGSGYELLDPAHGVLSLSTYPLGDVVINGPVYSPGTLVRVSYTFTSPLAVPPDIRRATTDLVAHWMTPRLSPEAVSGVESVTVGDVSVKYGAAATKGASDVPDSVARILCGYRRLVFA